MKGKIYFSNTPLNIGMTVKGVWRKQSGLPYVPLYNGILIRKGTPNWYSELINGMETMLDNWCQNHERILKKEAKIDRISDEIGKRFPHK